MDASCSHRRTFGEATDELVEEVLCADLELESIAAVLDADIEEGEGEHRDIGIAMVDVLDNGDGSLSWSIALLSIDQVGYLQIQGQVRLEVLGVAGIV